MPKEEGKKSQFVEWLEEFLKGIDDAEIAEVKLLATAIAEKKELSKVEPEKDLKAFAAKIVFDASNFLLKSDKQYFDKESFQKLTPQAQLFELLANYDQHNRTLKDGATQSENSIVFKQNTYTSNHGDYKIWTVQIRNEKDQILTAIFKGGALIDCLKDVSKTEIASKNEISQDIKKEICEEFDDLVAKNGYKITHNGIEIKTADLANKAVDKLSGADDIDKEPAAVKMPESTVPKLLESAEAVATEESEADAKVSEMGADVTKIATVSALALGNGALVVGDLSSDKLHDFSSDIGGALSGGLLGFGVAKAMGYKDNKCVTNAGAVAGAIVGGVATAMSHSNFLAEVGVVAYGATTGAKMAKNMNCNSNFGAMVGAGLGVGVVAAAELTKHSVSGAVGAISLATDLGKVIGESCGAEVASNAVGVGFGVAGGVGVAVCVAAGAAPFVAAGGAGAMLGGTVASAFGVTDSKNRLAIKSFFGVAGLVAVAVVGASAAPVVAVGAGVGALGLGLYSLYNAKDIDWHQICELQASLFPIEAQVEPAIEETRLAIDCYHLSSAHQHDYNDGLGKIKGTIELIKYQGGAFTQNIIRDQKVEFDILGDKNHHSYGSLEDLIKNEEEITDPLGDVGHDKSLQEMHQYLNNILGKNDHLASGATAEKKETDLLEMIYEAREAGINMSGEHLLDTLKELSDLKTIFSSAGSDLSVTDLQIDKLSENHQKYIEEMYVLLPHKDDHLETLQDKLQYCVKNNIVNKVEHEYSMLSSNNSVSFAEKVQYLNDHIDQQKTIVDDLKELGFSIKVVYDLDDIKNNDGLIKDEINSLNNIKEELKTLGFSEIDSPKDGDDISKIKEYISNIKSQHDKVDEAFNALKEQGVIQDDESKTHGEILVKYKSDLQKELEENPPISASDYYRCASIHCKLAELMYELDNKADFIVYLCFVLSEQAKAQAEQQAQADADAKAKADAEHQTQVEAAKAEAEAAEKARQAEAEAAAKAEAEQRTQEIANPGFKVEIGSQSVVGITTNGGTATIQTSADNFLYGKIYELQTVNGYRVCGLSHDSGKEISGLLVIKDNQVVCFESSVVNGNHRDVHAFIKEDNTWHSFSYNTLGLSGNGNDNINDDRVNLDQKIAKLLNEALGRVVASEEFLHSWQLGDDSKFSAFFGLRENLTIFKGAIEKPSGIFSVIKQAASRLLGVGASSHD